MTKSEKVRWTVAAVLIMAAGVVGLVWISKRRASKTTTVAGVGHPVTMVEGA